MTKWKSLVALSTFGSFVFFGCTGTGFRDAILTGVWNFVTGSVADGLTTLMPVADALAGT